MSTLAASLSSDFASLSQKMRMSPTDYDVKIETLGLIKKMKTLAQSGNALAQYRLAQVYPKNSGPYLAWMTAAAEQGLTNAQLALSISLVESKTSTNLRKAAFYLAAILRSEDSFIKDEAKILLAQNRSLSNEVNRQMPSNLKDCSAFCFFANTMQATENESLALNNSCLHTV